MIPAKYTREDLVGKEVRLTREIRTKGGVVITPGTKLIIVDVIRGHGFIVQSAKCPCCGMSAYIRHVSRDSLELVDEPSGVKRERSGLRMRFPTEAEYNKLVEAAKGVHSLGHKKMYSWVIDEKPGAFFARRGDRNKVTFLYPHVGFRPAFEIPKGADIPALNIGEAVVVGTLYLGDEPIAVPAANAVTPEYTLRGQSLTLRAAPDDPKYHMRAVYIGEGVFVCDRVMLANVSHPDVERAIDKK